jgi:hypothetical protein
MIIAKMEMELCNNAQGGVGTKGQQVSAPLAFRGTLSKSQTLFSSVSARGVCLVPCQVCRTIVCLSYKLPAVLLPGRSS